MVSALLLFLVMGVIFKLVAPLFFTAFLFSTRCYRYSAIAHIMRQIMISLNNSSHYHRHHGGHSHHRNYSANSNRSYTPPHNNNSGQMSRSEALAILGLQETSDQHEIKAAYYRLMKKIHPDHGGTEYLAKKINQAKDLLLS